MFRVAAHLRVGLVSRAFEGRPDLQEPYPAESDQQASSNCYSHLAGWLQSCWYRCPSFWVRGIVQQGLHGHQKKAKSRQLQIELRARLQDLAPSQRLIIVWGPCSV